MFPALPDQPVLVYIHLEAIYLFQALRVRFKFVYKI